MYYPSFTEFQKLTTQGNVIPVFTSYLADLLTPVSAFLRLQKHSKKAFLLESVEGGEKLARYSFLGCEPFCTIRYSDNVIEVDKAGEKESFVGNIFEYLDSLFKKYKAVRPAELPRFTGGAVGYFGYETVRLLEKIPKNKSDGLLLPEAQLMLFDTILVFDHLTHEIYIIANVFLDEEDASIPLKYKEAIEKIAILKNILQKKDAEADFNRTSVRSKISANFTQDEFRRTISTAKNFIEAGDIFQVVLSQRFHMEIGVDPFNIYRALRVINPSPYLYFIKIEDTAIIGSSPEMLVRVENGWVETRPIAGTRRRGKNPEED